MIFVAVGTQKFPFNRLLEELDQAVAKDRISEEIFAQIGHSTYRPSNFQYDEFLPQTKFHACIEQCDLLITHGGVGTIVSGLKHSKPVIVVPRLAEYEEHIDDHQLQIARSFAEKNYVLLYQKGDNWSNLIGKAKTHQFQPYVSQNEQVVRTIMDYICSI